MKTSDLRNCAGVGRDKLEERLDACANLIDFLLAYYKNSEAEIDDLHGPSIASRYPELDAELERFDALR